MEGQLFNIQRYSTEDGPGIRTTVFMKGCPLDCRWCANPESKRCEPELMYTEKNCTKCGTCIATCPQKALQMVDNKVVRDTKKCIGCFTCSKNCPVGAMTTQGKTWTVEEVVEEVMKDKLFYDKSGGGVTLSGGEPLMQSEFAAELLKTLRIKGVHTCIETTGFASPEVFRKVFDQLDLLYIDCKHPDSSEHKRMTGVPNEPILENIAYAAASGKPMVVRMPMIPGFNNSPEIAETYRDLFTRIGVRTIHLLPFHQFGESKWDALGVEYAFHGVPNMKKEELEPLAAIYREAGIDVQIGG